MTMPSAEFDNPAGRLYAILTRFKELPPNESIREALTNVLARDNPGDVAYLMERLSILLDLPTKTVNELAQLDEIISRDLLLRWVPAVEKAFESIAFSTAAISSVTERYNEGDLASLAVCSDLLHRHLADPGLPEGQLDEFKERVIELIELVEMDEEIDRDLRKLLLHHLRAIRQAILEAAFWGILPVRSAVAETIGDLFLSPQLVARKETSPRTWEKVAAFLAAATAALSFGTATLQAIEGPAPSPSIEVVVEEPITSAPAINLPSQPEVRTITDNDTSVSHDAEK
jgi:hypothetical protein